MIEQGERGARLGLAQHRDPAVGPEQVQVVGTKPGEVEEEVAQVEDRVESAAYGALNQAVERDHHGRLPKEAVVPDCMILIVRVCYLNCYL